MSYTPFHNEETRSSVLSALHDSTDQAAWGRFFDTYAGFIYGIARHEGLGEADADDIVQTVMTELVRGGAAASYDKTRGPFRGWLSQLTLWRVRSHMRQESRRDRAHREAREEESSKLEASPESPQERVFEAEWMETVTAAALDRLRNEVKNPSHFRAYYASAIEGLDATEVHRLCGISADNLYQIRRRIGARFRALLEETMRDLDAPDLPPTSW